MNNDLISREALKKATRELYKETPGVIVKFGIEKVYDIIDNAPTVEQNWRFYYDHGYKQAERDLKRPQGEWLHPYKSDIACECSNCHIQMPITDYFNFCPNCGAEMKRRCKI